MGKRLALLVGTTRYEDALLTALQAPEADLRGLADVLRAPTICGFNDVNLLLNASSSRVNVAVCEFFAQGRPDDLLLLYFSGHGVVDPGGSLYFCTSDTRKSLLRATALPASLVRDEMDSCRSRSQLLILDCCHAGAFSRDAKSAGVGVNVGIGSAFEGNGVGRVVLTASDATQFALQGDCVVGVPHQSVFTRYLIEALQTGVADVNGDGMVTVDEVYEYVYHKVLEENPQQTPGKWAYKQHGGIVLAKNPKPKARPELLDRHLVDTLQSDAPHSLREAAVRGLVQSLRDSRPGVALAAREVLSGFATDDSRTVSTLVRKALEAEPGALDSEAIDASRRSLPMQGDSVLPADPNLATRDTKHRPVTSLTPGVISTVEPSDQRRPRWNRWGLTSSLVTVVVTGAWLLSTRETSSQRAGVLASLAPPSTSIQEQPSTPLGSLHATSAEGYTVTLSVDGRTVGILPQLVENLEPGQHVLELNGGAGFEVERREILVKPGATAQLEPVQLHPRHRTLTISLDAQMGGAKVFFIEDGKPRQVTAFPAVLSVVDGAACAVEVHLNGRHFTQPIKFDAGRWDQELHVDNQSPWQRGSPVPHPSATTSTSPAPFAALPTLRVRGQASQCDATAAQVPASLGGIKTRLGACVTAKTANGMEMFRLRVSMDGTVSQTTRIGGDLTSVTRDCIHRVLSAVASIPNLPGCNIDVEVRIGP